MSIKFSIFLLAVIAASTVAFGIGQGLNRTLNVQVEQILKCQSSNKERCWEEVVRAQIVQGDYKTALDSVDLLMSRENAGSQVCHALVHIVGQEAYKDYFISKKDFKISTKASLCNFGFYHGFMESLIASGRNLNEAATFCEYVDRQLVSKETGLQCFHGIGHGLVGWHDPSLWGDEMKMIKPALAYCDQVAKTPEQLYRCASGVYNGIGNFYVKGEYRLSINKDDPLWVCRLQSDVRKGQCYGNVGQPVLAMLTAGDMEKVAGIVISTVEEQYWATTTRYITEAFASEIVAKADFDQQITTCHNLAFQIRQPCLEGYEKGLLDFGRYQSEEVQAFKFCRSKSLDTDERDACFGTVLKGLTLLKSKPQMAVTCGSLEFQYQKYCK